MEEKKYLNLDILTLYDALIKKFVGTSIDNKLFIGTYEEYEAANAAGSIPVGALVFITDDENENENTNDSTSSALDVGQLDYMILS